MQVNNWEAFLSDPELTNSSEYHGRHNGKYLFGKICHDALECLNNYLAVLSLIDANDVEISPNTLHRLSSKKRAIETAVSEIYSLRDKCRNLPDSSKEWPAMIQSLLR